MAPPKWKPIHPQPSDDQSSSQPALSRQPYASSIETRSPTLSMKSARRNVSVACQGCQQKRIKCDGDQPCQQCLSRGTECIYTADADARRKAGRKRKNDQLQNDSDLLHEILDMIKETDDEQMSQVLSLIRSNANLSDLQLCIKQQRAEARLQRLERSSELEDLHSHIEELQSETPISPSRPLPPDKRRNILDIGRLTDSPPFRVPASPWTSITNDDNLVSNLVSVWYTWDKCFYNWLEEDLFFQDMQNGDVESTYCSSFLVNALLCAACTSSDYDEAKTNRGAVSSLSKKFAAETERLLEEIDGNDDSITTAQGLAFMYTWRSTAGEDRTGYDQYLLRATSICQVLQEKHAVPTDSATGIGDMEAFHRALNTTCWGIFNAATVYGFICRLPQDLIPPGRDIPVVAQDHFKWWPYPQPGPEQWAYTKEQLHHLCRLSLIIQDGRKVLYSRNDSSIARPPLHAEVFNLYERLLNWRESLPQHLLPYENAPDSVYQHQMYFLGVVMTAIEPLRRISSRKMYSAETMTRANKIAKDTAAEVAQCCRLHETAYSNAIMNNQTIHPVLTALTVLLSDEDLLANRSDFTDLCVYLRAASRRWPFAMATLRMLQLTAREQHKVLPPETEKLFEEFESEEWEHRQIQRLSSAYPAMGTGDDDEQSGARTLSDFFESMNTLDVNDE